MEKIGDILPNAMPQKPSKTNVAEIKRVKCVNCGNTVIFKPKQFRQYCPKCALSISIKREQQGQEDIRCWICCDTGFVVYHAQVGGQLAEFAARCLCPEGSDKGSDVPAISQCLNAPPLELIRVRNMRLVGKKNNGVEGNA